MALMATTAVELPVVFTYDRRRKEFNRQPDGTGGEGIGVWHDGDKAWKLFAQRGKVYEKAEVAYRKAIKAGLPIGKPVFSEGTVKQGTHLATEGFALVNQWFDGRKFQGSNRFRDALGYEKISHSKSSYQYKVILAACEKTRDLCMRDIQGMVNGKSTTEPVVFFDIHTDTSAEQGQAMVDVIVAWGTQK